MKLTKAQSLRAAYADVGNRGPGFEMLRLVAASAVVLHHSMKIEHDIVRDDWIFQFSGGYTQLGLLAVSVFFALSGFLITPGLVKSGNVIGYLSRRFMRIMPLLVTIVVVTALVIGPFFSSVPIAEYYSSKQTWNYLQTITTFLSLQLPGVVDYDGGDTINGPIWTLHFEWMCYLLLAACAFVGVLKSRWLFLALYLAALVIGPFFSSVSIAEYYSSKQTWKYLQTITTFLSLQLPGVVDYDGGDTINGPIWTLHFEWMCYLLLAACAFVGVLKSRWLFLALYLVALFALAFGIGAIPGDEPRGRLFMFLFLFSYFGAGVLVFLFNDALRWSRPIMASALVALVMAYFAGAAFFDGIPYLFAPFLTAYLVVGIGLLRFPETPLTTGVDLSYGVYLSHSVILMMMLNLYPFENWLLVFAICLPLSYLVAFATWKLIEAPALRHKELPERMTRNALGLFLPTRKADRT